MHALKFLQHYQHWHPKFILCNLLLAIIVFWFIGAQHKAISFHADDYGFIYNGSHQSVKDIKRIFNNGDMIDNANNMFDASNQRRKTSFAEALYRPLLLLIMGTEKKLFGLNAYKFHLVHTTLHTCVSLILFNTIAFLSSPLAAFPLALFFAFHTSLRDYFFWQCYIQNSLEAFLFCLIVLLFFRWRRTDSILALCGCLVIFFIALLLRETLLVLPALAGIWILLEAVSKGIERIKNSIKTSFLFTIPIIAYILLRFWAHPFSLSTSKLGIKHFAPPHTNSLLSLKGKFFDLLTWFIDLLGLKWLPEKTGFIKLLVIVFFIGFIIYAWRNNPYKKLILLSGIAALLLSWPSILLVHCSRYIYLPTLCLAFLIGILTKSLSRKELKIFLAIFSAYALLQIFITNNRLTKWVEQTSIEKKAVQSLVTYFNEHAHTIAIGYPLRLLGTGTSQALKFYGAKSLHVSSFILPSYDAWEQGKVGKFIYSINNNVVTITSTTPQTLWFRKEVIHNITPFTLDKISAENADKVFSLSLTLESIEPRNFNIVYWNYENTTFEELNLNIKNKESFI
ncbi:hypothetical protein FJ364_02345 [Candidatus Dependentiae bacterium]|nr:hypothetical protein [Candidatus Dependentiae bacterium]